MILLDGVVYRANQDCKINVVKDNVTVPFSNVTFFDEDAGGALYKHNTKALVEDALNGAILDINMPNRF